MRGLAIFAATVGLSVMAGADGVRQKIETVESVSEAVLQSEELTPVVPSVNQGGQVNPLPEAKKLECVVKEVAALLKVSGMTDVQIGEILAIAAVDESCFSVFAEALALAKSEGLSVKAAVAIAQVAILERVDKTVLKNVLRENGIAAVTASNLAEVLALVKVAGGITSRFDVTSPVHMTRLHAIKCRALEMEKRGENTDRLWNLYWEIFAKDVELEE